MQSKDPSQKKPSSQAVAKIIEDVPITREDFQCEAVGELLDAFKYIYANGDARFASFLVQPNADLDYFVVRNQLNEIGFWSRLFLAPAFLDALPWLRETYPENIKKGFFPISPYYLDGDLAETLVKGGAYRRFPGTAAEAKDLGLGFCAAVFESRFDELIAHKSTEPWANWFMHVAWDYTWLGVDRRMRRLWILCATDTD